MKLLVSQSSKRIVAATLGCAVLALYLGWRGSSLSQAGEVNEIERSVGTELNLSKELVLAKLNQFESDMFNVVSAEYLQHTSHTPGVTADLSDSVFSAVGVMELKEKGFEPLWFAVNPKARESVSQDLLKNLAPEWQGEMRQMSRHLFLRTEDLKQEPMMVVLSRIELPNASTSAVAVAVLPARALKLNPQTLRESFLWDQKGYIWGYQNPAYVGAALKNDPLVKKSLQSGEGNTVRFQLNSRAHVGMFAPVPESNLFVGFSREITPVTTILSSWWISLALALMGSALVSFSAFRWFEASREVIEMPAIVVEAEPKMRVSRPSPATEDLESIIEEDTVNPEEFDPAPMTSAILSAPIPEPPASIEAPATSAGVEPAKAAVKDSASVESVLRRALAPFRSRLMEENVELNENIPAGLFVKAKPAQLQTAIEEIIKNALDAMKDGEKRELTLETGIETGFVFITIRDTGCGISSEDQGRIFEPFFTRKPESSRGLGLTVVKRLLELVQGESRVESEVGRGTAITLLIPAASAQILRDLKPEEPMAQAPTASSPGKMEIGMSEAFDLLGDEDESPDEITIAPMRDFAQKVEIRKPKVRMFD